MLCLFTFSELFNCYSISIKIDIQGKTAHNNTLEHNCNQKKKHKLRFIFSDSPSLNPLPPIIHCLPHSSRGGGTKPQLNNTTHWKWKIINASPSSFGSSKEVWWVTFLAHATSFYNFRCFFNFKLYENQACRVSRNLLTNRYTNQTENRTSLVEVKTAC